MSPRNIVVAQTCTAAECRA